jgi:hypothetical protein
MNEDGALRALSVGYAAAVDGLDGEAFASLFTGDGELWVPDVSVGTRPTVCRAGADALSRIPSGLARYHVTRHRVGPAVYAVDGDSATGAVAGVAHHLTASARSGGTVPGGGPGTDAVWYLDYRDRYRRGADGWRIVRRELHLRSIETRPVPHVGPAR